MLDVHLTGTRKEALQILSKNTVQVMLDVHLTGTRKEALQILANNTVKVIFYGASD